jgi:hypothetical protein
LQRFKKKNFEEIEYIDISSIDTRTGIPVSSPLPASEAPSRAAYLVHKGDVLVSTVRPDRNVVGFLHTEPDGIAVASNGFCVLRPADGLAPELLFAFCKSELFKQLVTRHATASMYPVINDGDVLNTPLMVPAGPAANSIVRKIRDSLLTLEKARQQFQEGIEQMNAFHKQMMMSSDDASTNE